LKAKATGGCPDGGRETTVAGAVVAGLAHDVNNLLQIMVAYACAVQDALPPSDPLRAEVAEIQVAGEHAARVTRQLHSLACGLATPPQVVDVGSVTGAMERMLRHALGKNRGLTVRRGRGLDRVEVDAGELERVLLNLVVNARDATANGGDVSIEMANVAIDASRGAREGVTPGRYVMVAVSDTGVGMDAATLARAFEPFFSTKEQGMGLGLAVVSSFAKRCGGHVQVHSEPGKGARFEVYLPRAGKAGGAPRGGIAQGRSDET
jgi:two-component system cell cycle sensor histidine kinase/response regulator CckA